MLYALRLTLIYASKVGLVAVFDCVQNTYVPLKAVISSLETVFTVLYFWSPLWLAVLIAAFRQTGEQGDWDHSKQQGRGGAPVVYYNNNKIAVL